MVIIICLSLSIFLFVSYVCVFPYVGIIAANGDAGGTSSGGASGGSVWIETNGFHGNGILQVNGGAGRTENNGNYLEGIKTMFMK